MVLLTGVTDLMESIGELVKKLRDEKGISQSELARLSGVDRSHISQLESGSQTSITLRTARALAYALQVKPEIFLSEDQTPVDLPPKSPADIMQELQQALNAVELIRLPLRGTVPAGSPFIQEQEAGEYIEVPKELLKGISDGKKLYALTVSGTSLIGDGILSGDTVIVQPETEIIDGKIYVVRLGNEVCARHVYKQNDHLRLKSSNGDYQEMAVKDVEILGRIVISGRWKKH